ncbi:ANTAR domain-containing protein [Bradyrhizobium sp. U87765 SZCCT0131]|uniref:ANTAR domain-containing response regulator n=1 Tax=unclassified Bradyrhizobium TaxID=2631580 RepID=UPI001BAA330F|nr:MULTISPECIES: ANTAR domain-containing protein [unclassified Bradyrhizobium]MBR1222349.1 ANTAR domain-containing protein [Bradyrhizobium sp. U87765 SZCCT0131]MBR1264167.1 ANTAR domain-containing protein [Bradyrhizobium sp. U87765 SZCCT0134]MBR1308050.1 ANTAR domain-containing protein [Bradyrhizobium sp. U87765 SZCCT0110]MBR1320417.1 ANTAR domain-containing protein [Bradyrhizobium sp. U87765 SZCCT0109]MBR1348470.1 ANTAR domain-containing protein [Bradyrhizobium sp. U87765 SZCCT0048]
MTETMRKPAGNREMAGRKSMVQELADLSVVVVAPVDDQTSLLLRELQRFRMRVRQVWPMPESVPGDADVVYCDYCPDLARRLPWIPGDARSALVVIVPQTEAIQAEALSHATPNAVLSRPFTSNAVLSSLVLARSQFGYEKRLRSKIEKLDENLRSMRTVERAKAILMATRQMPETEAYSFIRRQAMDRRVSASAVAAAIVDSFELLGYDPQH